MGIWNNLSCGVVSTAQALIFPKITNVMVNTGGNLPQAWRTHNQLQQLKIRVIVLSSAVGGQPTYYHYLVKNGLMPFFVSCCYKAKEMHLDRFYRAVSPAIVNVGFCKGEEKRAERLAKKNMKWRKFQFPMLKYTRAECEKILRSHGVEATSSYCWFCPKGPDPPAWVTDPLKARALSARIKEKEKKLCPECEAAYLVFRKDIDSFQCEECNYTEDREGITG